MSSSWSNCHNGLNNAFSNYPALMSDSRLWSQWQPDAVVNERIQKNNNIQSNWNYREYLQTNGIQIMNYNNLEACYELGLDPYTTTNNAPSPNVPYVYKNTFDTSGPGFGSQPSDLKKLYLSREQLNARLISPSIPYSK
jgi:hypothetical protein